MGRRRCFAWADDEKTTYTATFSYVSFKLFHLSILFRSVGAQTPCFKQFVSACMRIVSEMLLGKMLDINGSIRFLLSR